MILIQIVDNYNFILYFRNSRLVMGNSFDATVSVVTKYIHIPMMNTLNGKEERFSYRLLMTEENRIDTDKLHFANHIRYLEMPVLFVSILHDSSIRSSSQAGAWFDRNHTSGCVSPKFWQRVWVFMC